MTSRGLAKVAVALTILLVSAAPASTSTITLRVNDAVGKPGGLVALVVSTSAFGSSSQPVSRGQADLFALSRPPQEAVGPFLAPLHAVVFSDEGLAQVRWLEQPDGQYRLQFLANEITIEPHDGPLIAFYFRLRSDLIPGETYYTSIDLSESFFLDALGYSIPLAVRPGRLEVRSSADPYKVTAIAEDTIPGQRVPVSFRIEEPVLISEGQAAFRYDPYIAAGDPIVTMDPRHGKAVYSVDLTQSGLILVSFSSPDGTLNRVPGDLIRLLLPSNPEVPLGTQTTIALDPALTYLLDIQGEEIPIETAGTEFTFE